MDTIYPILLVISAATSSICPNLAGAYQCKGSGPLFETQYEQTIIQNGPKIQFGEGEKVELLNGDSTYSIAGRQFIFHVECSNNQITEDLKLNGRAFRQTQFSPTAKGFSEVVSDGSKAVCARE